MPSPFPNHPTTIPTTSQHNPNNIPTTSQTHPKNVPTSSENQLSSSWTHHRIIYNHYFLLRNHQLLLRSHQLLLRNHQLLHTDRRAHIRQASCIICFKHYSLGPFDLPWLISGVGRWAHSMGGATVIRPTVAQPAPSCQRAHQRP